MYKVIPQKKKLKKIEFSDKIYGYPMASPKKTFKIADDKVRNIIILSSKLAHPLAAEEVGKKYQRLIMTLMELLTSDDETGETFREALNRIEKFRQEIKNKYRHFLKQKELEEMGKQLQLFQKEANLRFMQLQNALYENINQQGLLPTEKTNAIRIGDPMMILTTNTQLQLEITTNKYTNPVTVTVPAPTKAYTAGEATTIYLLFKQGEITVTLEPTDWRVLEDDTQDDIEVGENRSYVVKEMNYIINRNMFGDAEFDKEEWSVRPNDSESTWSEWNDSQRNPNKLSVPAILEIQASNSEDATYENAVTTCNNLGNGWRLPTATELELIYLYNQQLNTPLSGTYWSATAASAGGSAISKAYTINMETGEIDPAADATQTHSVRCVRDIEM